MDKQTFFNELKKQLQAQDVADIEGILEEYEDHFRFKLADGYSEAEIATRLGDPKEIAQQYRPARAAEVRGSAGSRAAVAIGLGFLDIFAFSVFILFLAWVIALGAISAACAVLAVSLIGNFNPAGLIPWMPYSGAAVLGVSSLSLAVLAALGTAYCWRFAAQLTRTYGRWHKRCLTPAPGRFLSSDAARKPLAPRTRRILRRLTGFAVLVCGISFVLAFIIMALQAGTFGFWHAWRWFI